MEEKKKANTPTSIRKMPVNGGKNRKINLEYPPVKAVRLGESIKQIMQGQIQPLRRSFVAVTRCWVQLLPDELSRHCRIVQISQGRLKVQADSPSYLYELQLRSSKILEQLQRCCPGARIKTIKFVVG